MTSIQDLKAGAGWTPGRLWKVRQVLGKDGVPMGREDLAQAIYMTERQYLRWEYGDSKPRSSGLKLLVNYLKEHLTDADWAQIAVYEGVPELTPR